MGALGKISLRKKIWQAYVSLPSGSETRIFFFCNFKYIPARRKKLEIQSFPHLRDQFTYFLSSGQILEKFASKHGHHRPAAGGGIDEKSSKSWSMTFNIDFRNLESIPIIGYHCFWTMETTSSSHNSFWALRYSIFDFWEIFCKIFAWCSRNIKEGQRWSNKEIISKVFLKMENVVSQSSGRVVWAAGCFYDPEIMLSNDWNTF